MWSGVKLKSFMRILRWIIHARLLQLKKLKLRRLNVWNSNYCSIWNFNKSDKQSFKSWKPKKCKQFIRKLLNMKLLSRNDKISSVTCSLNSHKAFVPFWEARMKNLQHATASTQMLPVLVKQSRENPLIFKIFQRTDSSSCSLPIIDDWLINRLNLTGGVSYVYP